MNKQVELIDKAIGWFNVIIDDMNHITTGNLTHKVATTKGRAIRAVEFLKKHKNELPEEPSKVWHDANGEPDEDRQVLIISDKKFGWLCYYHRFNQTFYLECKPFILLCEVKKWAYLDDLIDIQEEPVSNPIDFEKELYKAFGQIKDFTLGMRIAKWFYDIGKNSQEPASEDLEKASMKWLRPKLDNSTYAFYKDENLIMELTHFSGYDMLDAIEFGAQWKERQFEKNRLAACDRQTEEEADIERDFVMNILEKEHRQPTYSDAIEYGMRLKEQQMQETIEVAEDHAMFAGMEKMKEQMMEKAVKWIEKNFNMPNDFEQHFRKAMSDNY